jgi:hypothetical protein
MGSPVSLARRKPGHDTVHVPAGEDAHAAGLVVGVWAAETGVGSVDAFAVAIVSRG